MLLVFALACSSAPLLPAAQANSCGSISNSDLRYYGQGSCGSIGNSDMRYLCESGRKWPGPF